MSQYLVHGACRGDGLHDVFPASVGTHGEAAPDDLAQGGEVW